MTTYLGKSCSFGLPRVPFVNCRQFMSLVISLLVLRTGCGIWLYQFLIIAYFFTLVSGTGRTSSRLSTKISKGTITDHNLTVPTTLLIWRGLIRDLFHVFLNKDKITLSYVISKPGIEMLLGSICLACFLNIWAASMPKQAGTIDLKISGHPHPNFGIKENRLFCERKQVI